MKIKNINSSKLEWEVFQDFDGNPVYCADGEGFVSIVELEKNCFSLDDQGSHVAEINGKTLLEALEIAQNYLATNYNAIFEEMTKQGGLL